MKLEAEQLTIFLISLSIMLLLAKLLGELFNRLKQPALIGEILAGIILGPTVSGMLAPGFYETIFPQSSQVTLALNGITSLAIVMLLLVFGLEIELSVVIRQSKTALIIGFCGIVFPFLLGFSVTYQFPEYLGIKDGSIRLVFALFMGTAMSISALSVIAHTLMDLNIFRTEIGAVIIASAMFNDLAVWIIFSLILSMTRTAEYGFNIIAKLISVLSFLVFMLLIARRVIHKIFPFIQKQFSIPGGVLNFIFILGFLCAALTEYIGIHAIFGAFIAGITVGDTAHLKEKTKEIIHQFVTNIFSPLFFATIGLRINFITNFDLLLVIIVITLAFIGKVAGCGLGAYWGGMDKTDALAIAFGMNSRGSMEIILGFLALQFGLIQEKVFIALVLMTILTSAASAPVMAKILKSKKRPTFENLIDKNLIIFSSAKDKITALKELVHLTAKKHRLAEPDLFNAVLQREKILPTGIANYLAIPHARVKIKESIVAISVNKAGLDFESSDNSPAKFITLLLTPIGENEVQLKLLSEIVSKFKNRQKVENMLLLDSPDEIAAKLVSDANNSLKN